MANKTSSNSKAVHSGPAGNAGVFYDQLALLAADTAAASSHKLTKVPAGTAVHRVVVKNTDMDTNAAPAMTAKIGFTPIDGSAAPAGADTAVAADGAFGQAAATTTYEIFPPYVVEKDSWLNIVVGTAAATGADGTIDAKVEGELLGVK